MKPVLFVFCLLFTCLSLSAQIAIIDDPDGYTNVRAEPNGKADIIHQIRENEIFWVDDSRSYSEWVPILIPKHDFAFSRETLSGYIHQSRLKSIESLPVAKTSDCSFTYVLQAFDSTGRIIERKEGMPTRMDGFPVLGIDFFGLPNTEVQDIQAVVEGKAIDIHPAFCQDLYNCSTESTIYQNGDTYFVYGLHSDGAGGYELVWVLTKDGLQQRALILYRI